MQGVFTDDTYKLIESVLISLEMEEVRSLHDYTPEEQEHRLHTISLKIDDILMTHFDPEQDAYAYLEDELGIASFEDLRKAIIRYFKNRRRADRRAKERVE